MNFLKCWPISAGQTINTGPAAGSIYSLYNDTAGALTLTQGAGVTMRVAGTATTGNYSLPQRGFVTLWWRSTSEVIIL